jgi:integrase
MNKPKWPYRSETILTPAPNGQWMKKHKGRPHYFGVWADPGAALMRWREQWPMIVAGHQPKASLARHAAFGEALCAFLDSKHKEYERGDLAWPSFRDYRTLAKRLLASIPRSRPVAALGPHDFARVLADASGLSATTRASLVYKTGAIVKWVNAQCGVTIEVGEGFQAPPRRAIRRQLNQSRGGKALEPNSIHRMLQVASPQMRAIMLLGINGGYGNADIAKIESSHVNLDGNLIDYYRGKTEAKRIVPLWTETADAIREVFKPRQRLLFVGKTGRPLTSRGTHDICRVMAEVRTASGVTATFYQFRYTFATVAAEVGDDHAMKLIMGHTIDGMSEGYIQRFPRERIERVVQHVHDWLYT